MNGHSERATQGAPGVPITPAGDVPVAVPLGSDTTTPSPQASATSQQTRETNTPAPTRPETHRRYGRTQLRDRADDLGDRDRQILELLAQHRFLTTRQIERFAFTGHASTVTAERLARRTLSRLHRDHLIQPLDRRVGGVRAGSTATVWQLAPAGARIAFDDDKRRRPREPSPRLRDHCLAVADTHLLIVGLEAEPGIDNTTVKVEPTSWRRYTGHGGEARWLQPDLAAVIRSHDDASTIEDRWFIEIDMGSESLTTLVKKCLQYETYRATGIEQASTGGTFPLVLWIFHGRRAEQRRKELASRVARHPRLTTELFHFATGADTGESLLTGGQP